MWITYLYHQSKIDCDWYKFLYHYIQILIHILEKIYPYTAYTLFAIVQNCRILGESIKLCKITKTSTSCLVTTKTKCRLLLILINSILKKVLYQNLDNQIIYSFRLFYSFPNSINLETSSLTILMPFYVQSRVKVCIRLC